MNPLDTVFNVGSRAYDGKAVLVLSENGPRVSLKLSDAVCDLAVLDDKFGDVGVALSENYYPRLVFPSVSDNMRLFLDLFESPDRFAKKYARSDLKGKAVLFIGDTEAKGLVWRWTTPTENVSEITHGVLLRWVASGDTQELNVIGNPNFETLTVINSGAILPKQEGVDASYVSMWTRKALSLKPYLSKLLAEVGATSPIKLDIPKKGEADFIGEFEVTGW